MARPKKQDKELGLNDMLGLLQAGLKNPKPNNLMYNPHEKQINFHSSVANGRQFLGGNRSGKTVAGINEDIWWLTGRHPYLKLPGAPVFGRVVTVDFKNGAEKIIIPNLRQWLVPSDMVNGSWEDSWNGATHTLTLENGSQLEIMSHDQELDKFAGVPRHFIHFDEEPPFDIFKECKARLTDYNGRWWMTMTPVEGMTWTYDEIYEKRHTNLITVVQVNSTDNPNISQDGLENLMEGYDEDERKIRGSGEYIAISGLVFKWFNPEYGTEKSHVIDPQVPPASWTHYTSLDAGYNNPTAILRHAVDPATGTVITYMEHYRSEWTTEQHANKIKADDAVLSQSNGITTFLRIADPAIKQRQQVTGHSIQIEYALNDVHFATGATRDINAGLDKMNNYIRLGKWYITADCVNLIKEMRKYKRAQYSTSKTREINNKKEEPQKKDDHAIDSCRYFFSFMPDLNPQTGMPLGDTLDTNVLQAPTHDLRKPQNIDTNFSQSQSNQTYFVDEYLGGEW